MSVLPARLKVPPLDDSPPPIRRGHRPRVRVLLGTLAIALTAGGLYAVANPAQAAAGSNTLSAGQSLTGGQQLVSSDGRYRLVMQTDGNLVEYVGGRFLWENEKAGSTSSPVLKMQADGNLVEYGTNNAVVWNNATNGHAGARLVLRSDAGLALYAGSTVLRNFNVTDSRLDEGHKLSSGMSLTSANHNYQLTMQADGNLVLYTVANNRLTARWNTQTSSPGSYFTVQTDGNAVVYNSSGKALWSTGRAAGAYLVVQDDGNLVLQDATRARWSSQTTVSSPTTVSSSIEKVITAGTNRIGTPYSWGGGNQNGPTRGTTATVGFDCSALMQYAFWQGAHIDVQRSTKAQYPYGQTHGWMIPSSQMRRGDMIYFSHNGSASGIFHVALYLGKNSKTGIDEMLAAPQTGDFVKITRLRTDSRMPSVVRPIK